MDLITDIKPWMKKGIRMSGVAVGLWLLWLINPALAVALSKGAAGSGLWALLQGLVNNESINDYFSEWEKIVSKRENLKNINEWIINEKVDIVIDELLEKSDLKSDIKEFIWKELKNDVLGILDDISLISKDINELSEIIKNPIYQVACTPLQLGSVLGEYRPHEIIERPEVQPLFNSILNGNLRHLVLFGPGLSGKTMVAVKLAIKWLMMDNKTAIYLRTYPYEYLPFKNVNEENTLIILDIDTDSEINYSVLEFFLNLETRFIFCFRTGELKNFSNEKRFIKFLENRNFRKIKSNNSKIIYSIKKVYTYLEDVDLELTKSVIKSSAKIYSRYSNKYLTINNNFYPQIHNIIQAKIGKKKTSLLGLGHSIFLSIAERSGQIIDKKSLANCDLLEINEIVEDTFWEALDSESKKLIRVFHWWYKFVEIPYLPRIALIAGYESFFEDKEWINSLEKLIRSGRILEIDGILCVWHIIQIEIVNSIDYFEDKNMELWLEKSALKVIDEVKYLSDRKSPNDFYTIVLAQFSINLNAFLNIDISNELLIAVSVLLGKHKMFGNESIILSEIAENLFIENKKEDAVKFFNKAYSNIVELQFENPDKYTENLITITIRRAQCFIENNIHEDLLNSLKKIDSIFESFKNTFKDEYYFSILRLRNYNCIASYYKDFGSDADLIPWAKKEYNLSKSIYEKFPDVYGSQHPYHSLYHAECLVNGELFAEATKIVLESIVLQITNIMLDGLDNYLFLASEIYHKIKQQDRKLYILKFRKKLEPILKKEALESLLHSITIKKYIAADKPKIVKLKKIDVETD